MWLAMKRARGAAFDSASIERSNFCTLVSIATCRPPSVRPLAEQRDQSFDVSPPSSRQIAEAGDDKRSEVVQHELYPRWVSVDDEAALVHQAQPRADNH